VRKRSHHSFVTSISLNKNKTSALVEIPELQRAKMGLLTTSQNFRPGSILSFEVGGEILKQEVPFTEVPVPVGEYTGVVKNTLLGTEQKVRFKIEENKIYFLE
jgi:hypothetical protein